MFGTRRALHSALRIHLMKPLLPRQTRKFWRLEFELLTGRSVDHVAHVTMIAALVIGVFLQFCIVPATTSARTSNCETNLALVASTDGDAGSGVVPFSNTLLGRGKRVAARKRGSRSKEEIEREQRELIEKTRREVEEIIAEFHAKLPRAKAKRLGAIYARYSSRFQSSIPAQVRTMFEIAVRDGVFVPAELVFYDLAVRGYRDRRPGFDALKVAVAAKKFKMLLVFGTSRLFRKAHRAIKFVEEDLVEQKMDCYFIQQNINTATDPKWRMHLMIQAAIDEDGTSMYAENVRAAHQGMFLRMEVCGTLPLGYCGEPIEGQVTRRNLPKCKVAIDRETRPYVKKIFRWWCVKGISMDQIARLLNDDPNAPQPPKSLPGIWTHASVRRVLTNARYRGFWEYGKTYSEYQSKQDYLRQLPRDKALKCQHFTALRIISDEVWYKAQALLLQERGKRGRKPTKSAPESRPKLFNGIFWCPIHDRSLMTAGAKMMVCKHCRAIVREKRPLFSQLNRAVATRLTLDKLAELIRGDDQLVAMIIETCRREADAAQQPDPARLAQLKAQEVKKTRAIEVNRRNPGETEKDQEESENLVTQLRRERADLSAEIGLLEAARARKAIVPNEAAVRAMLAELGKILSKAALADDETEARLVRRLVVALTGGKIMLSQQGERKAQRGWLQGRFRVLLISHVVERLTGFPASSDEGIEVTIDYRRPSNYEELLEAAVRLRKQGLLHKQIAAQLKCTKSKVTELLQVAAERVGEVYEDGRSRRSHLDCKHLEPPPFERSLPEFTRRLEAGELLIEIAAALGLSKWTMTKLNKLYRERAGLPPLDGRSRRKSLDHKNRPTPPDET